jgi:hypothetical protein
MKSRCLLCGSEGDTLSGNYIDAETGTSLGYEGRVLFIFADGAIACVCDAGECEKSSADRKVAAYRLLRDQLTEVAP